MNDGLDPMPVIFQPIEKLLVRTVIYTWFISIPSKRLGICFKFTNYFWLIIKWSILLWFPIHLNILFNSVSNILWSTPLNLILNKFFKKEMLQIVINYIKYIKKDNKTFFSVSVRFFKGKSNMNWSNVLKHPHSSEIKNENMNGKKMSE